MREHVPNLHRAVLLDGVGHWPQQEAPKIIIHELISSLQAL